MTDITPELRAKLARWEADAIVHMTPERIAATLREQGIGVIDLDRQRCTIDERVYESALHRGRIGRLFLTQRHPSAETWDMLTKAARADG